MPNVRPPRLCLAFVGLLIGFSAFAHSATAANAADFAKGDECRVVSPRFQPTLKLHAPSTELVRTLGGAKLRDLVGSPCLPPVPQQNV